MALLVKRLVRMQFPQWAGLAIEPVPSAGTDNALYRLGSDMVVRLPRSRRTMAALAKERSWLPRLAKHLPLPVPMPLADGTPGEGYPFEWAVYRWIPGEDATKTEAHDERGLARELARFLSALRRIDASDGPPPGDHNVYRGVPLRRRDADTRSAIARLRDLIDVDAASSAWESALGAPAWEGAPVWVHGDLDARNLLIDHGRLSAVIDWGCAGVGDPACDVAVAWKVLSAETRAVFRATLAVDDSTWRRARGWALSQAVGALSYFTPNTNFVLFHQAERWLKEALADEAS